MIFTATCTLGSSVCASGSLIMLSQASFLESKTHEQIVEKIAYTTRTAWEMKLTFQFFLFLSLIRGPCLWSTSVFMWPGCWLVFIVCCSFPSLTVPSKSRRARWVTTSIYSLHSVRYWNVRLSPGRDRADCHVEGDGHNEQLHNGSKSLIDINI